MALQDVSPASPDDDVATEPSQADAPPGDAYGSSSITAGTAILKVLPPIAGRRTSADAFWYDNLAAAIQTVTFMVPFTTKTKVSTDMAAGQASISVDVLPTGSTPGNIAASDVVAVQNETGAFDVFLVSSLSGNNIVITASVGTAGASGLTQKILKNAKVFFMGAPGDHPSRQFKIKASTYITFAPPNGRLAVTSQNGQPIVVHSDNNTTAGYLHGPTYSNPKL